MSDDKSYVVHGAYAQCTFGTRPARLVIPASHGDYIHEQPQLNVNDFLSMTNIRPFGLCTSLSNPAVQAEMKAIVDAVQPPKQDIGWFKSLFTKEEDVPLEELPPPECVAMCTPQIIAPWLDGKDDVKVSTGDALLNTCKNFCICGRGDITIVHNGQRE
ncbi:DUF4280 domain-containing protein [Paenibacillus xylanivorans]|uniref:DUF4280 domain-containing protein n=1 Tax=Paenibacillus xylanivorans TaxID=1705561 RepID=A0A0M9BNF5_9BACL|nr:DUF4280 domain-containing protein [Paenibacillus xylanivorans]KOY15753.1 hypothetical protein AMS66_13825 [Paenibacillus xylanivorans]